jgi:hypothetical protein
MTHLTLFKKKLWDETNVGSTNINPAALRQQIRNNNYDEIENWLNEQKWFSHDSGIPHIKLFCYIVLIKKAINGSKLYYSVRIWDAQCFQDMKVAVTWDLNAKTIYS